MKQALTPNFSISAGGAAPARKAPTRAKAQARNGMSLG